MKACVALKPTWVLIHVVDTKGSVEGEERLVCPLHCPAAVAGPWSIGVVVALLLDLLRKQQRVVVEVDSAIRHRLGIEPRAGTHISSRLIEYGRRTMSLVSVPWPPSEQPMEVRT